MRRRVVGVGDELDRARAVVARGLRQRDRLVAQRAPQLVRDHRRRRLLDHLLVAPLQRALALAERDHVAVRVPDHLHLDVPRARQEALEEHAVVAEAGLRLALRGGHRVVQVLGALDDAHPAPAAARRRLDQHGVLDSLRRVRRDGAARRPASAASFARTLSPISSIASGDGPTKTTPGRGARARQRGVLGQEAVARVQRVRAHRDDLVDRQVRGDADRGIGLAHVRRARIHIRVDRDRADAEPVQRADHAARDLAPVGDEDRAEHAQAPSARAMTICCTSSVPSPMVRIFASR